MKYLVWAVFVVILLPMALASSHGAYSTPRSGFSAADGVLVEDTAVYSTGYVSQDGSLWQQFSLTGDRVRGDWVLDSASSSVDLSDIRYVAIFSCTWSGGWDCSETWQVRDRGPQGPPANWTSNPGSVQGDFEALQEFYAAMDGPNWDDNSGWESMTPQTMGDAFGVTVYPAGHEFAGRVRELSLSGYPEGRGDRGNLQDGAPIGNNLVGDSIPDTFGNLTKLTHLRLKGNDITARVDNWIQGLERAQWISLSASTGYGGQDEINLYDRVRYNHASKNNNAHNKFRGELPDDLSMLQDLELLEIANSDVTGTLPTRLPGSIRGLFLTNAKMTGPLPSWANAVNMTHLYLGQRYDDDGLWSGEIPEEWNNMQDMAWFSIETSYRHTDLTGAVPQFTNWKDVRYFETTGHYQLEWEFPNYLFTVPGENEQLHTLGIGGSGVYGEIADEGTAGLVVVGIPSNNLTGHVPEWIDDDDVVQFNVRDNDFTGPFPDQGFNDELRWIRAENNRFTGSLPGVDPTIENFQELRFHNNQFTGDIPPSYGQITASEFDNLQLENNLLDGSIPPGIFGKGWRVRIQENKFTPEDLVPILDEDLSGVRYLPQKPFGQAETVSAGATIDRSSFAYAGNSYQWVKDGTALSGETSPTIDTSSYGAGEYVLEIEHPDIDFTFTSEPITVEPAAGGSVEGDHAALMDLYAATNGDGWWDNSGWSSSTPEMMGSMYGVTVWESGEFAGRVKEIDLFQNNLVGTIESVPFDELTAVQRMTLKQPLTQTEHSQSPQPGKLSGQLPASIGGMQNLEWLSLGGQYCRIDMSPDSWNEWNHCPGFESGKNFVNGNVFVGQLPPQWGQLSNLQMLELRRSDVTGPVPDEWEGLTSLVGVYLNDNLLNGNLPAFANSPDLRQIFFKHNRRRYTEHDGFTGPVPDTYAQLENLNHLRLGYNSLSGDLPVFDTATDIRTFDIDRNELTRFPTEIFQDGRNPLLNYVLVYQNPLGGRLADQPVDPANHNLQYFAVSYTDMDGPVPFWASELTVDLFNFDHNRFSSLDPSFYDADAPLWGDVRNVRLGSNELSGELPDVLFARLSHEGAVASMPSDSVIELSMDLGVVETGTVTTASSDWIQDDSKRDGPWDGADFTDHTVIIDPDGVNIQFEVLGDGNVESGYLYSRDRADPSGTEGLDYVIRPTVENRIIRFKLGDNRWVARNVESVDYANNRVTLDKPIAQDVSGVQFQVHERGSGTYVIQFYDNFFTGPIPQSWGYIPTHRDVILSVDDNDLTGEVPDFTHVGINYGGSLNELSYQDNRFVFRDILPNFAANQAASNSHQYAPQKPFGAARSASVSAGSSFTHDFSSEVSHGDNVYQWEKDGSDVSGQTSNVLSFSSVDSGDAGTYRLRVTNPNAPALTLYSADVVLSVS